MAETVVFNINKISLITNFHLIKNITIKHLVMYTISVKKPFQMQIVFGILKKDGWKISNIIKMISL